MFDAGGSVWWVVVGEYATLAGTPITAALCTMIAAVVLDTEVARIYNEGEVHFNIKLISLGFNTAQTSTAVGKE